MTDYSIDAIKIARAIQKDNLSILDGKEFKMRDRIKKNKGRNKRVKKHKSKYTLNELGSRMNRLDERMDRFETKLDQIGDALFEFIKTTNVRLINLEKDVKNINARLDYNGLKKLPENN